MDKRIVKLGTDPLYVGLADRECSLFVNPRTGDILVDEGAGEGRINGAVLFADKEPRFHAIPAPGGGGQLLLSYRRHLLTFGVSDDLPALHQWAGTANQFLSAKARQETVPDANSPPTGSAAETSPPAEPEYQFSLCSASSLSGGPYRTYIADQRPNGRANRRKKPEENQWNPSRRPGAGGSRRPLPNPS